MAFQARRYHFPNFTPCLYVLVGRKGGFGMQTKITVCPKGRRKIKIVYKRSCWLTQYYIFFPSIGDADKEIIADSPGDKYAI